ncbi:MAG: alpha/beta fold hydrolase [Longimicrobiales bacterium]
MTEHWTVLAGTKSCVQGILRMAAIRRNTQIGDIRIHSVHAGAGSPVVLLHGLSGSHNWWRYTVPALSKRYAVHIPELVGFGRSRGRGSHPGIPEMAQLMTSWLAAIGVNRPHLVGHSMGGQIAVHMIAAGLEVRTLTLVCASGLPRDLGVRAAARMVGGALPPRGWGALEFLPTMALDALRAGPTRLVRASWQLLTDDVTPMLSRVRCPALVVWGALDPLVPLAHGEQFARALPDARLVVISDAAHNVMADRPAEFNPVLLNFLDSHNA